MTNRDLIDRWFAELWGRRNVDIIEEMISPDCITHGLPVAQRGSAGFRGFFDLFSRAFSRVEIHIEDSFEVGEQIAFRCVVTVLARDGRPHEFVGGGICRFRDGQFIEAWNMFDNLALLMSLGHVADDCFVNALLEQVRRAEA